MSSTSNLQKWLEVNDLEKSISWSKPPPERLSSPPWRVPETLLRSKDVNSLLEFSLQVQSSTIQTRMKSSSDLQLLELSYYILSNSSLNISGLLSRYLTSIGIKNSVICGVYKPSVVGYDALKGCGQVFLKIEDFVIDNVYLHQTEKATQKKNVKDFYSTMPHIRTTNAYMEELPSKTELPMIGKKELGDDVETYPEYLESASKSQLNLTKHLANACKNDDINAGVVMYDIIMRKFIKDKFDVEIAPPVEEMETKCWGCGEVKDKLSLCSGCQFARYCGKDCITKDWAEMHKLMHRVNKKYKQTREERKLSLAKLKL